VRQVRREAEQLHRKVQQTHAKGAVFIHLNEDNLVCRSSVVALKNQERLKRRSQPSERRIASPMIGANETTYTRRQ
jgi:hypothetical protein